MSESATLEISEDALKLMVKEHGVRGTARMLQMDERATDAFRQRVTRGKWLHEPGMSGRDRTLVAAGRPASPVVAKMSPAQAVQAELQALGQKTRVSIAKGLARAGEVISEMGGVQVIDNAHEIKSVAQTADLVHGWKDAAPQVKIRLDVLSGSAEAQPIDIEATVSNSWAEDTVDPLDEY
jgi:hypothetical protein